MGFFKSLFVHCSRLTSDPRKMPVRKEAKRDVWRLRIPIPAMRSLGQRLSLMRVGIVMASLGGKTKGEDRDLSKQMEFLKATKGDDWKTLEALVTDLDHAGYWKGETEQSYVEKRRHVRKMLATLVFREAASRPVSEASSLLGRHVFASTRRADDSGELVRVYKQVFNLTFGELQDIFEDEESNHEYRMKRAARSKALAKAYLEGDKEVDAAALSLEELAEETMRQAWPGTSLVERRWIVLAALLQHQHSEEALQAVSEWCHAKGFDIGKVMDEYLRAAGVSAVVDAQEATEIARPATEYFKVVDELEGLDFGRMCLKALAEARTNTVEEFAEREGIDAEEAAALFASELGEYADEFQGVLEIYWRDAFGWTLDEHLRFAVERRGERG